MAPTPCIRTHNNNVDEQSPPPSSEGRRNIINHLSMDEESVRRGDQDQLLGTKINTHDDDDEHFFHDNLTQSDFLRHFLQSSGPPQIIILCLLLALALGSTIGVVPAVVEDRYARLRHGYSGEVPCLELAKEDRPPECLAGNEDAQNSAAIASFISNTLTFMTSSMMGSLSDEKGRRCE